MNTSVRFTRPCPTCGRFLEIPVTLLGRTVGCSHCNAEFRATAPQDRSTDEDQMLNDKIDRLLRDAEAFCYPGQSPLGLITENVS